MRLHTKLALETASEIADPTTTIGGNVRHLSYVIVHLAAGEQQDENEAQRSPHIAALDDGQDVRPCNICCRASTGYEDQGGEQPHPVDGALDRRVRSFGHVASDPVMHLFGCLWPATIVRTVKRNPIRPAKCYPLVKSYRRGSGDGAAFFPTVGGKKRSTGAVCNPS